MEVKLMAMDDEMTIWKINGDYYLCLLHPYSDSKYEWALTLDYYMHYGVEYIKGMGVKLPEQIKELYEKGWRDVEWRERCNNNSRKWMDKFIEVYLELFVGFSKEEVLEYIKFYKPAWLE